MTKLIFGAAVAALITAQEGKPSQKLDWIKKLAGEWSDPKSGVKVTYRVTSGGSAVMEVMIHPGGGEMLTVYTAAKAGLEMTHYCSLGNQPRMRAEKNSTEESIRFVCVGADNLDCAKDKHMHSLTITVKDDRSIEQAWALFENGERKALHAISLTRS